MYCKGLNIHQKVLSFILLFLFFWGCTGRNELSETTPVSIRKKVVAPIPSGDTFQYGTEEQTIPDNKAMETLLASVAKKTDSEYNPEGKIDPFVPFLKRITEPLPDDGRENRNPYGGVKPPVVPIQKCFSTPLVKVGLSQLKLVGVIRSRTGNKALVQDASNQGYIVERGTCIGLDCGKVSEILKEKIIIEEKFEDHEYIDGYWKPKIITRKREMALLKPEGV